MFHTRIEWSSEPVAMRRAKPASPVFLELSLLPGFDHHCSLGVDDSGLVLSASLVVVVIVLALIRPCRVFS